MQPRNHIRRALSPASNFNSLLALHRQFKLCCCLNILRAQPPPPSLGATTFGGRLSLLAVGGTAPGVCAPGGAATPGAVASGVVGPARAMRPSVGAAPRGGVGTAAVVVVDQPVIAGAGFS